MADPTPVSTELALASLGAALLAGTPQGVKNAEQFFLSWFKTTGRKTLTDAHTAATKAAEDAAAAKEAAAVAAAVAAKPAAPAPVPIPPSAVTQAPPAAA